MNFLPTLKAPPKQLHLSDFLILVLWRDLNYCALSSFHSLAPVLNLVLLHVRNFVILKYNFCVLVDVNLLGPEIDDFLWLTKGALDLSRTLT
jgi:hypothetical protein